MATRKKRANIILKMTDEELIVDMKNNTPKAYEGLTEFFEDKYIAKIVKIIAWDITNEEATNVSLHTINGDTKHFMSYFGD